MSTFLRLVLMEEVFFESTKVAQTFCGCLSSFVVFVCARRFLDDFAGVCFCLSIIVGAELRFCMSWRSVSVCSSVVIALSWGCSFCVVDALTVIVSSSLLLRSASVAWLVVELGLFVLKACSWCAW